MQILNHKIQRSCIFVKYTLDIICCWTDTNSIVSVEVDKCTVTDKCNCVSGQNTQLYKIQVENVRISTRNILSVDKMQEQHR
jgi:hypothetical protein